MAILYMDKKWQENKQREKNGNRKWIPPKGLKATRFDRVKKKRIIEREEKEKELNNTPKRWYNSMKERKKKRMWQRWLDRHGKLMLSIFGTK